MIKKIVKEFKGEECGRKEIDKEVKGSIISLVDSIFREGIEKGVSDIHIEHGRILLLLDIELMEF